jgi:hypothetical protein
MLVVKEAAWESRIEARVLLSPSMGDKSHALGKRHTWMVLLQLGGEVFRKRTKFICCARR